MASSPIPLLEPATERYACRMRELLAALEGAQDLLFEVAEEHEQVVEALETIGKTLSREAPTDGTERGLSILSGVLRALRAGTVQLDALSTSQSSFLHTLRRHATVVDELAGAVSRSASPRAPAAQRALAVAQLQS